MANDSIKRGNNPKNKESKLFKRLTRLFSGPIVNLRRQAPRQLRRRYLDKYKFQSASGAQFKKQEYNPFSQVLSNMQSNYARGERYGDFEQMEYTPEVASSLDIYADEMTTSSDMRQLLKIECKNDEIKALLENLFHSVLNIEFNMFGWCRTMCKFGDFFLYLDIDKDLGITNVIGLPPNEVERLEGEDKTNPNYVQYQWNTGGLTFENWQIAHFRILGNDKYAPYGTSVLEPARRIWRQLTLIEDAMMAYRIVRSPERRVFYVDVGNINPQEVEQYMQKVMTQMKRNQVVDADSGRVDLRYNPMSIDEDYFIPVRGDVGTRVETLPGGTYTGDIDDVRYLRDKLFAALKVPASYISRAEGSEEDKTTLAQKDVRFARTIQRLQRAIISEMEKVATIHLYTLGFRNDDLISFKLSLNNPSKIAELQELEHWRVKFDTASAALEGFFSRRWVAEKMFGLTEEEFVRNQREMFYDRKVDAALEMAANEAAGLPGNEAGGGPMLPAEGGGAPPLPGMPPEEGGAPPEGAPIDIEEPEPQEGDLLASPPGGGPAEAAPTMGGGPPGGEMLPPAKRDDDTGSGTYPYRLVQDNGQFYVRKEEEEDEDKSKGKKYSPVTLDSRQSGANLRHYSAELGGQLASSSDRNLFKGLSDLKRLASLDSALSLSEGLSNNKETTYNEEEKIFQINNETKKLIEGLELRDEKDEA
jgi:hypothetical protein